MSKHLSNLYQRSIEGNKIVYATIVCDFSAYLKARCHSNSTLHAYLSTLRHLLNWPKEESSKPGRLTAGPSGGTG